MTPLVIEPLEIVPMLVKFPLLNSKLPLSVIVKVSTQPLPDALLSALYPKYIFPVPD